MTRYINDQNKVVFLFESGTYGVTSGAAGTGQWIGEVTELAVDDNENLLVDRFMGANTRSVSEWVGGPISVEGTLTYHPQDMRFLFWAIGSNYDFNGTGSNKIHYANQVNTGNWQNPFCSGTGQLNAPISFGLEDSKTYGSGSVFLRTIKGACINKVTLNLVNSEKVNVELDYVAQTLNFSGGTSSLSVTALTNTPYIWSNCSVQVSGTTANVAKEINLEINQNLDKPYYLNGSRVIGAPIPGNRDNKMTITYDLDQSIGTLLYDLYKRNASFNCNIDMNADRTTGSQHTIIFLSGCKVSSAEVPSVSEIGTNESTAEIVCPIIIGSAIDTINYNPW